MVKTILLNKGVFEDNDKEAELLRQKLREEKTFLVNVMSSPGAGKTTLLISLINLLSSQFKIAVMEADIDSDVDAVKISQKTGCDSIQLHTGGMCHLDAAMTEQGLNELGKGYDLVFLENVGNLVCPAEYDTGAHLNMTILSVPEGDDKPLKYPLIYQNCDLIVINKTDVLNYFSFDREKCRERVAFRNPKATVIEVSAKTGDNTEELAKYFINILKK